MLIMHEKRAIMQQFAEICELFPDTTIDVKLEDLQRVLARYGADEHQGLEYMESELRSIRAALSKFREANKSVQDMPERVETDSKTDENSRSRESQESSEAENTTEDSTTEDSGSSGGAKENAGFFKKMWSRMRGKGSAVGGDTRWLLMELEALGMSIGETC